MAKRGGKGKRSLVVAIELDGSEYERQAKKIRETQRKQIKELFTDEQAAEKAKLIQIDRTNKAKVDAYLNANKQVKKASKELLTDEEVNEKAKQVIIDKTNKERVNSVVNAGKREKEVIKQLLTDEQVTARARSAIIDETNRKRIAATTQALRDESKSWLDTSAMTDKARSGLLAYAAGFLTIGAAAKGLTDVIGYFDRLHAQNLDAVNDLTDYRKKLLELAALKGDMGVTQKTLIENLQLQAVSGLSDQAAADIQRSALGIAEVVIDPVGQEGKGSMSRKEFQGLLGAGAQMTSMLNADPNAMGKLVGLLPFFKKNGRLTAAEGEAQLAKIFDVQSKGGFESINQAANTISEMSGFIQNDILSLDDSTALVSALSTINAGEAKTKASQALRAVTAGAMRSRGMAVSPDIDPVKSDQYLKDINAGIGVHPMVRLERIADDVKVQQAAAAAKGLPFMANEYFMSKGFANAQDVEAMMDTSGLYNTGKMKVFLDAARAPLEKGVISKRFNQSVANDEYMQAQMANSREAIQKARQGMQFDRVLPLQKSAWAALKDEGWITDDKFEDWSKRGSGWAAWDDAVWGGYHSRVNLRAQSMLVSAAKEAGIDVQVPMIPRSGFQEGPQVGYMGDAAMQALSLRVSAAGGNPLSAVGRDLSNAARNLNQLNRPAPMQGRPPEFIQNRP